MVKQWKLGKWKPQISDHIHILVRLLPHDSFCHILVAYKGQEGPEGEKMYSSTLSSTSVLGGGGWSTVRPGCFTPGLVWMGTENLAPTRIQSPDYPACIESLYRLCYTGLILVAYMKSNSTILISSNLHTAITIFIINYKKLCFFLFVILSIGKRLKSICPVFILRGICSCCIWP